MDPRTQKEVFHNSGKHSALESHSNKVNEYADHLNKTPGVKATVENTTHTGTGVVPSKFTLPTLKVQVDDEVISKHGMPEYKNTARYDPKVRFQNTSGEQARMSRMNRVGDEFRSTFGGDSSNYRS